MKVLTYSDAYCTNEINTNVGLYNDIKVNIITIFFLPQLIHPSHIKILSLLLSSQIQFNVCHSCVTWPVQNNANGNDAAEEDGNNEQDDNFEYYHQFESKLCSAADYYKSSCSWGCKRMARKGVSSSASSYHNVKRGWTGFEKFFLFFWSVTGECDCYK